MLPTGCRNIDELLGGGLPERTITQLYGPAGSGKTIVCLQALKNASLIGKKVMYVDSEGGFSQQRLEQIAGDKKQTILKNTILVEPTNFEEQIKIMDKLENEKVDLIIVDSITALYRIEMTEDKVQETNKALGKQLTQLLGYARKNNIPILLTNQVYSNFDNGNIEPVGGDLLKYISKVVVEMSKEDAVTRKMKLKKHLFKKEDEETKFEITGQGLKDKSELVF